MFISIAMYVQMDVDTGMHGIKIYNIIWRESVQCP